jgi:DNA-binding winged helix-turn-helix (wHTH) protein/class 3 adenylate cyclase
LYRFAHCTLDTVRHTLRRDGQELYLPPKVFEVLHYLIGQRHRVISKQELCDQIWQGVAISDAALESCIRMVRAKVGDSGKAQRIIQTQRGYGYQFVIDVEEMTGDKASLMDGPEDDQVSPLQPLPAPPLPASGPMMVPPPQSIYPCLTCQHPNRDAAIFCVACGSRLRQACEHCGQSSPLPAVFCSACGQPFMTPGPLPDNDSVERKPITVLCCAAHLVRRRGERVDIDTRHSVMELFRDLAEDVMRLYGGRLHSVLDERLLIMFGVPVVQEDDARRAVRVALELRLRMQQEQRALSDGSTLLLCMGLHTGPVVIGGRRDTTAVVPTVVGDVMSLAMVLQEQAPAGTILCSEATARLLQGTVRLTDAEAFQVPGQPQPVLAYTVLEDNRGWRERTLSPFVGREREMATLHALLAQVEAGRGQVVGVVGEVGIGKSRLVYEFRQSLQEHRLTSLPGRCLSYGHATPYLPVLDLLRQHCGIGEADCPEDIGTKVRHSLQTVQMEPEPWAPVLLHLLGAPEGSQALAALRPETRKARPVSALTQLCLAVSRQHPLVLEIEDLHWSDASSEEWLRVLVDRMAGVPILLSMAI